MSLQATIKRYSLIIDYTKRMQFPSFRDIHEMLGEEGFQISDRTLQRDIEDIRDEFGLEISYDSSKRGYFIDEKNSISADHILHFLELAVSAQVMIDSLREGKKALKYIAFDSYEYFKGLNILPKLLLAIKAKKKINFSHTSYQNRKTSTHYVNPYMLKEYQGRWYLYGENVSMNDFWIYGIDRIDNLKISDETFLPKEEVDISERFENIIGVSGPLEGQGLQEIILSMNAEQGMYFKGLPWFKPYETITDTKVEFRISLNIIPNFELLLKLLMHSDKVMVVSPDWLRKLVKKSLEVALARYSSKPH